MCGKFISKFKNLISPKILLLTFNNLHPYKLDQSLNKPSLSFAKFHFIIPILNWTNIVPWSHSHATCIQHLFLYRACDIWRSIVKSFSISLASSPQYPQSARTFFQNISAHNWPPIRMNKHDGNRINTLQAIPER